MTFRGFRAQDTQRGGHARGGGRGRGGDRGRGRSCDTESERGYGRGRGPGGDRGRSRGGSGLPSSSALSIFSPGHDPVLDTSISEVEKSLTASLTGRSKDTIDALMPRRPGFGTQGRKVVLWANSFSLAHKGNIQLYRYSVNVSPDAGRTNAPTGKKMKRIVQLLLEDHFPGLKHEIATDFKSNLVSATELELREGGYRVLYHHELEDEHAAGAPTYKVRVQSTGTISLSELIDYLTSTSASAMLGSKDEIIQSLNIIMGHTPKASMNIASVGSSKHFRLAAAAGERLDLGAGLTAIRGFFYSVRAATARILVNVQVKNAAFFTDGPLDLVMRGFLNENGHNKVKLGTFLKRLSVNVTHIRKTNKRGQVIPRVKQIHGLATREDGYGGSNPPKVESFGAGPKGVLFYLLEPTAGDSSGVGKAKKKKGTKVGPEPPISKGKYISVYDFFQQRYGIVIQDTTLPVINVGSRQQPSYIPAQTCVVLPGQPSRTKLSPVQTQKMIRFAVRRPAMNAESIVTSGLQTLGIGSEESNLKVFGLELNPKLLAVPGRVLKSPDVKFGGNRTVTPRSGSWNMQSAKFSAASELPYWTFLWISYPGGRDPWKDDGALKPTIDAFTHTLREIGIGISNCTRGQHIVVNTVDQDIDAAVHTFTSHPRPPLFILVILPAADTVIYNRVKYVCDVKEGLRNVCVVANKFAKPG